MRFGFNFFMKSTHFTDVKSRNYRLCTFQVSRITVDDILYVKIAKHSEVLKRTDILHFESLRGQRVDYKG